MPRFIAVHTLPYNEGEWDEFVKSLPERLSQLPPGVKYNLTYCGFSDGTFFCDWEAPDKETIEQIFKGMEMPYEAIYSVKLFSTAKMGYED